MAQAPGACLCFCVGHYPTDPDIVTYSSSRKGREGKEGNPVPVTASTCFLGLHWMSGRSEFPPPSAWKQHAALSSPTTPVLSLRLEPSCAPISAGLLGLIECLWSPIMNCPCPSRSSDCVFISGWALTRCQLSRAGLQGQACRDIYVAAHFAPVGPWVMSGTAFLSVRVLMATG